ncbi:MAG: hypothetical protein ACPG8W_03280 [Candidatus Promineifilaceae bacterium]
MGGRGSSSGTAIPFATLADLPYTITSHDDAMGGAVYPFLERTKHAWRIVTRSVETSAEPLQAHTFGQERPTLRWVNGDAVKDLYIDGVDTQQFLADSGLELDMRKGGFVLSKRISRLMRPHFVSGFFEHDDVNIAYLKQTVDEAKVWDGAGVVSRRMLEKMVFSAEIPASKREHLQHELATAQRVEFTIMRSDGQSKGHAIVSDNLQDENGRSVDFLLPRDNKAEIRLDGSQTFVGLSIVHGRDEMRLDIQSLINLHPFFDNDQLLSYLQDEGELFAESIQTGEIAAVMGRIDSDSSQADLARWPLKEYLASGGHPMWFRTHVKALFNQHLKRLNSQQLHKMRLPIPGGRHYVMPVAVGKRAGLSLHVERGEICIDPDSSTAWVNDNDWLGLQDSAENNGIADILGGADNDDALWLHPFTDHDGKRKVLAWRSPNQLGEWVLLKPTKASAELPFATTNGGHISYPAADSQKLPTRIDHTDTDYLDLVNPPSSTDNDRQTYDVDAMDTAIWQAMANKGALGMYCNSLMLNKALFGRLPEHPPAPLEDIIDSAVKTGADLSQVVQWNYDNTRKLLDSNTLIPSTLANRLSIDRSDPDNLPPSPRWTKAHWLAQLQRGVQTHIDWARKERDRLAAAARPPQALFDAIQDDAESMALGKALNRRFAAVLNSAEKEGRFDRARFSAENYLALFPPAQQQRILLASLASIYTDPSNHSDIVAWLAGSQTSKWFAGTSIAQTTIASLQKAKLLHLRPK